jgi:hypothetical protein
VRHSRRPLLSPSIKQKTANSQTHTNTDNRYTLLAPAHVRRTKTKPFQSQGHTDTSRAFCRSICNNNNNHVCSTIAMEHPILDRSRYPIPSIEIDDVDLHKQSTHTHVARFEHFLFWSWFRTSILLDLSPLACRLQGPTCQNITASHPPSPASDELVFFPPTTKLIPAPTTKTPNSLVSTVLTTTSNSTRETQGKLRKRFFSFLFSPLHPVSWVNGIMVRQKTEKPLL